MGRRAELNSILQEILGSNHVYYQPPETITLVYPCIVYELSSVDTRYANDSHYLDRNSYTATIIDKNPDSELPEKMKKLSMCSFNRHYTSDNLHHFSFRIYY